MRPTVVVVERKKWALTRREMAVVGFMWQGLEPGRIARKLHIDRHTVACHMSCIYRKFGVKNRGEFHKVVGFAPE